MFTSIQKRLFFQRWLNLTTQWFVWVELFLGCLLILFHRIVGVSGTWMLTSLVVVPVISWLWLLRSPVQPAEVIRYAESVSGQSGLLWFGSERPTSDWEQRIHQQWKTVSIPKLTPPPELRSMLLAFVFAVSMSWVPLKQKHAAVPLIQAEMVLLEDTLQHLEELTVNEDGALEEWREQINDLSEEEKVSSVLRQSDFLQEQMEQRHSEMMDAIEQGMDALESGQEQSIELAMKQLQEQGLIPESAMNETTSMEQQGQDHQGSVEQLDGHSSEQMQEMNSSSTAQQSQKRTQQMNAAEQEGQQQQSSAQQKAQKLQQQMSQLQDRMQQMSKSPSSLKSMTNEQLQKLQDRMANQGQGSDGKGKAQGSEGSKGEGPNGEPCKLGTPNCLPSRGGETAPLTYGDVNPLNVSDSNLASIQGVTEVDWDHNVYFGQGAGEFRGQTTGQLNNGVALDETTGATFNNNQIPPNQRTVVQRYFSKSSASNSQGVSDDANTKP